MENKSITKNFIYKLLLNIFNIVIPILVGPYAYRTLGPDSMKVVGFAESLSGWFLALGSFGVYQYGLREVSRIRENKEKLYALFNNFFAISLITNLISIVLYFLFVFVNHSGTANYSVFLIYAIILFGNIFYIEWVNEALENYNFITIKTIIIRCIYIICLFTFVKSSENINQYTLLVVLYSFFNNLVSFLYVKKHIPLSFKNLTIKKHIKPLFYIFLFANGTLLFTTLDRYMLGEFLNDASLSFYAISQIITYIITSMTLSIVYVTVPRLSNYLGHESEDNYLSLLDKVCQSYMAFLFPASIGMFLLSKEIILIYGGIDYAPAIAVLKIFSIYMIFLGLESILSNQVIYIKRKEKVLTTFVIICGTLNLILNSTLLKLNYFTPVSAIATTAFSTFVLVTLEYLYIRKVLKIHIKLLEFKKIKYLLISLLFIPITYLIKSAVSGFIKTTILVVLVNAALYFVILFITKDTVLMYLLEKLSKKIRQP